MNVAPDVFISYSSLDKPVADRVYAALKQAGVLCWKAPESLTPGRSYPSQIIAAIHQCRVMVFILSKSSNSSPQVLREVERAVHDNLMLVPFRIEPVIPTGDLEYYLSVPHWLDAYEGPLEPHLETLLVTIAQLLEKTGSLAAHRVGLDRPPERSAPPERKGSSGSSTPTSRERADQSRNAAGGDPLAPLQATSSGDVSPKICPRCGTEYGPEMDFCPRDGSALRVRDQGKGHVGRIVAERYRILRRMGEGGMGEVYLAEHVKMGRKCAIKMIHPRLLRDVDVIRRFGREAANASRITHPNVAAIYDFGDDDGAVYIAMEFVDGESLAQILKSGGALPEERAKDIACQVAEALQAAHDEGVVHRDLKPDNVMIAKGRRERDVVKVVDFGIAKAIEADPEQDVTQTGLVVGTPRYMSPEQLAGDAVGPRSDLYSLGSILFEMLTGAPAFTGPTAEVLLNRRNVAAAPHPRATMPDVTRAVDEIVVKAMDPLPENRFESATVFRDAVLGATTTEIARESAERDAAQRAEAIREAAGTEAAARAAAARAIEINAAKEAAAKEAAAKEAAAKEAAAKEAAAKEAAAREAAARVAKAKEAAARRDALAQESARKEAAARETAAKEVAQRQRQLDVATVVVPETSALVETAPVATSRADTARTSPRFRTRNIVALTAILLVAATVTIRAFVSGSSGRNPGVTSTASSTDTTTIGDQNAANPSTAGISQTTTTNSVAASSGTVRPSAKPDTAAAAPGGKLAKDAGIRAIPSKGVAPDQTTKPDGAAKQPTGAGASDVPATSTSARTVVASDTASRHDASVKEAATREAAAAVKRLWLAAAGIGVDRCVAALKSEDASQMAELYPVSTPEDTTNKRQLLSLMRRSAARLTVVGSPSVAEPEMSGESARNDFTVHLTWRGPFGGPVNRVTRFRVMIASISPQPQIDCRIVGNANLQ